jgi:hypothetical protein
MNLKVLDEARPVFVDGQPKFDAAKVTRYL